MTRSSNPLPKLLAAKSGDALRAKMAKIPAHMIDPHVGIANVPGVGVTVVAIGTMGSPMVWHPHELRWVDLIT